MGLAAGQGYELASIQRPALDFTQGNRPLVAEETSLASPSLTTRVSAETTGNQRDAHPVESQ